MPALRFSIDICFVPLFRAAILYLLSSTVPVLAFTSRAAVQSMGDFNHLKGNPEELTGGTLLADAGPSLWKGRLYKQWSRSTRSMLSQPAA